MGGWVGGWVDRGNMSRFAFLGGWVVYLCDDYFFLVLEEAGQFNACGKGLGEVRGANDAVG